jgi:hypothetical protein
MNTLSLQRVLTPILALLLAIAVLPLLANSANAAEPPPPDWVFPLVGTDGVDFAYSDTFGAPRGGGRTHHGVDIGTYGIKGVPVVAAADGVIKYVNWSSEADDLNEERCCTLAIQHADGWETWYIHMNNDDPGTDNGLAWGIAEGILPGVEVKAGQLIGWDGDSGNAEGTIPHLHWEVHLNGAVVNPTPHADAALRILEAGAVAVEPACAEGLVCDSVVSVESSGVWSLWDQIEWPAEKTSFYYGNPGDLPFMGDWDGDGIESPGLYRQLDGFVYVRHSNTQGIADLEFFFGNPDDVPLVGDFDGDGRDSVSIWRISEARVYIINELGADGEGLGAADYFIDLDSSSFVPFVGDFDGDGTDTIGYHDPSNSTVSLRNSNSAGEPDATFSYGDPGDRIIVGDWDGDGDDTVGTYRTSNGRLYLNFENESAPADWVGFVGYPEYLLTAGSDVG